MSNPIVLILRGIRTSGLRPVLDAVAHAVRTRWVEARFADPARPLRGLPLLVAFLRRLPTAPGAFPPAGPVVRTLGPLAGHARDGQTLTCSFAHAALSVTVIAADLLRLRVHPPDSPPAVLPYAVARADADWPPTPFTVTETADAVELRTGRLTCAIARADGRVTVRDPQGALVAEAAPVGWSADGRVVSRWTLPPGAHAYGLGERAAGLDLRGRSYVNWNTDPRTYSPGDDPLYLCIPFLVTLSADGQQSHALLLENTARSRFDLSDALTIEVEDDWLGVEFFYGPALTTILDLYTERTGRVPLFPRWTLGYQQCRWSYFPDERVRRLARDFRQTYDVPCEAIHLDIHYMDGYRCFTWDRARFPDPAGLIADLHAQGFRVVPIIDPGIKADRRYRVFQDGLARGCFCRYPDGEPFIGPVWPGNCAFPDFTDPRVRDWWGDLHRELVEMGADGIWDDMNEPALFGEDDATIPGPVRHDLDGRGGDHRLAHNVYGLLEVRATVEGLARLAPDRRPFVLTRSGWAGVQRYAAHWTADNQSTWDSLRLTLPMVLGLGLSGVAFTGADVGGFAGFASGELFTRWLQMSIFFPFCRAHTEISSPDQEPWSWGEPYLRINRETIRLRYRLLPYLYTALWQCTQTGIPPVRPLFLAFQDDPVTHTLADEFLCGDALLVSPVLEEGATRRSVYLPAGSWYDFWSDVRHEGPTHIEVDAPLERVPIFVRAGSVVPITGAPASSLQAHVYPPVVQASGLQASGPQPAGWLYEDDGETLAYQRGDYRLTRFTLTVADGRLDVRQERVAGDLPVRPLDVIVHPL